MADVRVPLRSPTGTAWVLSAVAVITAGELFDELRQARPASFFHVSVADNVLLPVVIGAGVVALGALAWLLSLYLWPGSLELDRGAGTVCRRARPFWRRRVVTGPLSTWHVRLLYFSQDDVKAGRFKRLELKGPQHAEVILFGDLREPDRLVAALTDAAGELGSFDVDVERD